VPIRHDPAGTHGLRPRYSRGLTVKRVP